MKPGRDVRQWGYFYPWPIMAGGMDTIEPRLREAAFYCYLGGPHQKQKAVEDTLQATEDAYETGEAKHI